MSVDQREVFLISVIAYSNGIRSCVMRSQLFAKRGWYVRCFSVGAAGFGAEDDDGCWGSVGKRVKRQERLFVLRDEFPLSKGAMLLGESKQGFPLWATGARLLSEL